MGLLIREEEERWHRAGWNANGGFAVAYRSAFAVIAVGPEYLLIEENERNGEGQREAVKKIEREKVKKEERERGGGKEEKENEWLFNYIILLLLNILFLNIQNKTI